MNSVQILEWKFKETVGYDFGAHCRMSEIQVEKTFALPLITKEIARILFVGAKEGSPELRHGVCHHIEVK